MSSWQSHFLQPLLRGQKLAQSRATIESTRRLARRTERLYSVPGDVRRVEVTLGSLTHEWLVPEGAGPELVIFHIHGGGFVFPLWEPERYTIACLARLAKMRAFLPEYRLAPEHPFPVALEDCISAYRWLISEGGLSPGQIVFAGESAGGNLVITTMLALREAGDPLPIGGVCICPAFDFEGRGTFATQNDPMVHTGFARLHLRAYQGSADPRNPLLSPLYADLRGLPRLLIQTGELELYRGSAEELAARAQQAGVAVRLQVWPEMWHFWHLFVPFLPEAREAMEAIKVFLYACAGA